MRILLSLACLIAATAEAQALYQFPKNDPCQYVDQGRLCNKPNGWWVLRNGLGAYVAASGAALTANNPMTGAVVPVTTTRASSKSCTNGAGVIVSVSNNQPCVETAGVLVEDAATNYLLRSGDLGNAAWTATALTATSASAASPDGTTTATDVLVASPVGAGSTAMVSQAFTGTAVPYAVSVYLKGKAAGGSIWLGLNNGTTFYRTSCVYTTAWSRCGLLATANLDTGSWTVTLGQNSADSSQTGITAQEVYAWGAQAEFHVSGTTAPYVGSYIPTAGSTAARGSDGISFANQLTSLTSFCEGGQAAYLPIINPNAVGVLAMVGQNFVANSYVIAPVGANTPRLDTFDSTSANFNIATNNQGWSQQVVGCDVGGTLTMYCGGTPCNNTNTGGAGTGILTVQRATTWIGSNVGANVFADGWLKNLCWSTTLAGCTP